MIRRRGANWQVTVYAGTDPITGRERRVTRTVKGRPSQKQPPKEARDLEARLLVEVGSGQHREARLTMRELLDRWLELAGPDLSPTTAQEYRRYVDRVITPRVGSVRLDRLTPSMIDRLYSDLRDGGGRDGRPLAPATIRQVHEILHRSLKLAERWGWIARNPASLASPPKVHRSEIRPPTAEQVRRMLEAADVDDALLTLAVWLAAITGARRGELCGIRWSDVGDNAVVIRRSVGVVTGGLVVKAPKTHQAGRVALDDETVARLRSRHTQQAETALACGVRLDDSAYVLSEDAAGREPLHPDTLTDRFRRLARRLGISCRLHDLRHWHVSQALGAGLPVRDIADRVGHASARMTLDVYRHTITTDDRRAVDSAAAQLQPKVGPTPTRRASAGDAPRLFE